MFRESRKSQRFVVNRLAKVRARHGALPRDCLLTDISDGGVRLHAEGIEVPDEFVLLIGGPAEPGRECRVVWRLGHEIGAEFTDARRSFTRNLRPGLQSATAAACQRPPNHSTTS